MLQQHAHCAWVTTVIKLIISFVVYGACWACWYCHNPPNYDIEYRIFIVRRDVDTCDYTPVCRNTETELHWKLTLGRKFLAATGESNLRQRRASPMF